MRKYEVIIKDTHRGLWYVDGRLERIVEAGRYEIPGPPLFRFMRQPKVECVLVDVRERDLTIKGQEILTADKVAIRVSIIVGDRNGIILKAIDSPLLGSFTQALDPITRWLGWRTDLKLKPFIQMTDLTVEKVYKLSKTSLYTVLLGTKTKNGFHFTREL